ncbi:MAG TPA: BMP family protein [Thermoanaerobaculia bacterium]|nr:BMP family protein [Thermoanaerobaculia bacterium]
MSRIAPPLPRRNVLTLRRLLLACLAVSLLARCSAERPSPAPPPDDSFKVGLLTPGSINDAGWNAVAYEGLDRLREKMGAEISHQETRTPAEFEEGFRWFGANGFDLAFGHGFEFQDAALAAAELHPGTVFITTSGSSLADNVAPMVFELEEATYLLGMLAAMESKSGKAGLVGGIRLPSIASTFLAFREGARSIDPEFEVAEVYTGNFDDLGAARLAARSLIDSGADFLMHQSNEAGRGVFQACRERNVRCFGTNRNQNDLAPDVIVASAVLDVPAAFLFMGRLVKDGRFETKIYWLGMQEGIVSLAWNEELRTRLRSETMERIDAKEAEIREGRFEVPRGEF